MKIEPDAAKRAAATEMWQLYVAFIDVGFSEAQALQILSNMVIESMRNTSNDD